jgi:hypothetical protein
VRTEDIPDLAGTGEAACACLSTASAIMQLLRDTCHTDGASYMLAKDAGSRTVRLFELSNTCTQDQRATHVAEQHAEDGSGSAGTMPGSAGQSAGSAEADDGKEDSAVGTRAQAAAKQSRSPLDRRIAQLCFSIAERILDDPRISHAASAGTAWSRAQQLLERCVALPSPQQRCDLHAEALLRLAHARLGPGVRLDPDNAATSGHDHQAYRTHGSSSSSSIVRHGVAASSSDHSAASQLTPGMLTASASDLAAGVLALGTDTSGKHVQLECRLHNQLRAVYSALAEVFLADHQPGAALRCAWLAACHLNAGTVLGERSAAAMLRVLRISGLAHAIMVCFTVAFECLLLLIALSASCDAELQARAVVVVLCACL